MGKRKERDAAARRLMRKAHLAVLHAEQAKGRAADRARHAGDWAWKRKKREAA